jgi:tetratricopeptide (TPR) repeat protein
MKTTQAEGVQEEVANVVARASEAMRQDAIDERLGALAFGAIASATARGDDYVPVKFAIQKQILELDKAEAILRNLLIQIERLEADHAQVERFSEQGWQRQRTTLLKTFDQDPPAGTSQWLLAYAQALSAWQLEACKRMASEPFPLPTQHAHLPALFLQATQTIRDHADEWANDAARGPSLGKKIAAALMTAHGSSKAELASQPVPGVLEMLMTLIQDPTEVWHARLDETTRAILLILAGRIQLYVRGDPEIALSHFQQARKLVPDDGRPYAVAGDYYRAQDDSGQARRFYQQAVDRSPNEADGCVGMGLWCEDQKRWDEVTQWYDRAIRVAEEKNKDIATELTKFLAPVSGNLLVRIAFHLQDQEPERALQLIQRAESLGINGDGAYPEYIGFHLEAELFKALGRRDEAANAFYEAATRLINRNETQAAIDALRRAKELRPDHMSTYWTLVDAWRIKSWRPDPPFVSAEDIEESLKLWQEAVQRQLPGKEDSWAYVARAMINDQLARLPGITPVKRWMLGWEAVCYCERAIVLALEQRTALARWYRFLSLGSGELHATAEGMRLSPDDRTVLEDRIICLVNYGAFEDVKPLLEMRRSLDDSTLPDAFEAFIKVRTADPEAALGLIDKAIKNFPDEIWFHEVRSECYRRLGKVADAEQEYRWILERYHRDNIDDQSRFGLAAYMIGLREGNMDRAIDIFSRVLREFALPTDSSAYRGLGESYLAQGDLARGEELLKQAIRRSRNVCELDDLINSELQQLERASDAWLNGASVREVLDRVVLEAKAQIENISKQTVSAEEELHQALEPLPEYDAEGWLWIGAKAGLARLHAAGGLWSAAREIYFELLRREPTRFPEARQALEDIADKLREAGDERLKDGKLAEGEESLRQALLIERELGRVDTQALIYHQLGDLLLKRSTFPEALDEYSHALAVSQQAGDKAKQAETYARMGYAHLRQGNLADAEANFIESFALYRADNSLDGSAAPATPGATPSNLARLAGQAASLLDEVARGAGPAFQFASVVGSLISDVTEFWEIDEALTSFGGNDSGLRSDFNEARRVLLRFLDRLYQLVEQETSVKLPIVTPIILEIGHGLIPADTSENWSLFKTYIPQMRNRLLSEQGVSTPGVRVRGNNSLGHADYAISLDENLLPFEAGSVHLDKRYCTAPPTKLRELGIPADAVAEATNPLTGAPGGWIADEHWDTITRRGLELWPEPLAFIINHLEAVLRDRLADFLGVQEVEPLIEKWSESDRGAGLIKTALPDQAARLHFGRLLRTLVRQRVPIVAGEDILEAIEGVPLNADSLPAALRAARLRLKASLPGNSADAKRIWLPAKWQDAVATWLRHDVHEFIADVRSLISGEQPNLQTKECALVVRNLEIAPYVRRLVEYEFPKFTVLSGEELLESSVSVTAAS